jgi:hypothetical protein
VPSIITLIPIRSSPVCASVTLPAILPVTPAKVCVGINKNVVKKIRVKESKNFSS